MQHCQNAGLSQGNNASQQHCNNTTLKCGDIATLQHCTLHRPKVGTTRREYYCHRVAIQMWGVCGSLISNTVGWDVEQAQGTRSAIVHTQHAIADHGSIAHMTWLEQITPVPMVLWV